MSATRELLRLVADRLGVDDGLERIGGMLRIRHGEELRPEVPLQWGSDLYMPGLTAVPWHDPSAFAWRDHVESAFEVIRAEYDYIAGAGVAQPYLAGFDQELHEDPTLAPNEALSMPAATGAAWTVYFLIKEGRWFEPNAGHCPHACRTIAATPLGIGESLFSVLAPRSEIALHSGGWNVVLTCHLALHVPEGCGLRVGREAREWQEGEVLVVDDTFAHTAWNSSDAPRSCLIWDIWHPDMTALEIEAVKVLLPLLGRSDGASDPASDAADPN